MHHRLAPEAAAELDAIWYYAATESSDPERADRLIDSLTGSFLLLSQYPHMGRRRDADLRPGLRSFPAGAYLIIYRVDDIGVLILHVVRGGRDIAALFGQ